LIASVSVVAVGRDDALVDAPSSFDLDVSVFGENGGQAGPLLVGEQVGASGQHAPDALERVTRAVPMSAGGLLNALSAAVGRVASQHNHMRWTHHRDTVGQLVASGRLETGELVHHDDLDPVPEGRALRQEPDREHLFGAPAGACAYRRQVDHRGDELVSAVRPAPGVLVMNVLPGHRPTSAVEHTKMSSSGQEK
jgi:hypothetical protein